MSELNRIKTVLFTAHSLNDALTNLDDLGVSYRECDSLQMWVVNDHNIQFWPSNSSRMALTVFADEQFYDYDDRLTFLAHQRDMAESEVPATSPETAGEHLSENEPSTESVDNTCSCLHNCDHQISAGKARKLYGSLRPKSPHSTKYLFDLGQLRQTLRIERRLKRSLAKGLSS